MHLIHIWKCLRTSLINNKKPCIKLHRCFLKYVNLLCLGKLLASTNQTENSCSITSKDQFMAY